MTRKPAVEIRWLSVAIVLIVSIGVGLKGVDLSSVKEDSRESRLDLGQQVYQEHCAACHGINGDGRGREAHRFQTKPTDFTSGVYKFKSTYPGSLPFSGDIYRSVATGIRGTGMLAQLQLTDSQRRAVVEYIKTFSRRFEGVSISIQEGIVVPEVPEKTPELVSAGKQLYREAGCGKCHGQTGRGDGPSAPDLKDSEDNPVKIPDLTTLPRKTGDGPEDLYRILITGLDGTPMPSYKDVLDESQSWAVVYYLESIGTRRKKNCMGMMGRMMDMVGEECIGMQIDMPAARARMMGRM